MIFINLIPDLEEEESEDFPGEGERLDLFC